jgi:ABC-2 type transport system permease protein
MNALTALVKKDLVLYFSNRRALVMNIVAPIVIAAFFGSLFDSASSKKPAAIPIAMVDLDQSEISGRIVAGMKGDSTFALQELAAAEAFELVKKGKVRAVAVLPKGFGDEVLAAIFRPGEKPVITVQYDPSQAVVLAVVRGLLTQHVLQAVGQSVLGGAGSAKLIADARAGIDRDPARPASQKRDLKAMLDSVERLQAPREDQPGANAAAPRLEMPFATREQEVTSGTDRKYNSYAHSFAGMGVQFILFMGMELGIGMLLARRLGLWKRLRAAPLSKSVLFGSRIASGALTAIVLLAVIYAAAMALFGVRIEGSVLGFAGVAIAFSLLTASFGLLVAALGRTPEATRGLAIFATLILVMLGGAWVPSFVFPEWLQTVSLFVPTRWAVDGLDAMTWRGLGAEAALAPIGVMLAFSAAFAAIAVWRFDWEE